MNVDTGNGSEGTAFIVKKIVYILVKQTLNEHEKEKELNRIKKKIKEVTKKIERENCSRTHRILCVYCVLYSKQICKNNTLQPKTITNRTKQHKNTTATTATLNFH